MKSIPTIKKLMRLKFLITFLIIGLIISVLPFFLSTKMKKIAETIVFPQNYVIGVWEWSSPTDLHASDEQETFSYLHSEHINTIYLSLGDLIGISEMPDGVEKIDKQTTFTNALKAYITQANHYGIHVQGLVGGMMWSDPDYQYLTDLTIRLVSQYNQTNADAQLSGIQFDIEPYRRPDFPTNKTQILTDYLQTVNRIVLNVHKANLGDRFHLGFAIPYWLDGENKSIPRVDWDNISTYPVFHLFHILNNYSNSYVAMMDYRNTTVGADGSITHALDEIEFASSQTPSVKIIIGQELTDVLPKNTTFYGQTQQEVKQAALSIIDAFANDKSFSGIAFHTLEAYKDLHSQVVTINTHISYQSKLVY